MEQEDLFLSTLKEIFSETGHKNIASISCKDVAKKMGISTNEVRKMAISSKYCPIAREGNKFKTFLVVIW